MVRPDYYVDSIHHIDFKKLKKEGIENVLVDIDNTIVPYHGVTPEAKIKELVEEGKTQGLKFCIVSNAKKTRCACVGDSLEVPYIHMANKPSQSGILKAMECLGGKPENTVIVGDQFCTDVIAGKRAGIKTILVEPITRRDFFMTKIYRFIEWFFKKGFKKENMK